MEIPLELENIFGNTLIGVVSDQSMKKVFVGQLCFLG